MIGEPDAGKPHVRFDEGVQETCDIAARLRPTLPEPPICGRLNALIAGCLRFARTQPAADSREPSGAVSGCRRARETPRCWREPPDNRDIRCDTLPRTSAF